MIWKECSWSRQRGRWWKRTKVATSALLVVEAAASLIVSHCVIQKGIDWHCLLWGYHTFSINAKSNNYLGESTIVLAWMTVGAISTSLNKHYYFLGETWAPYSRNQRSTLYLLQTLIPDPYRFQSFRAALILRALTVRIVRPFLRFRVLVVEE